MMKKSLTIIVIILVLVVALSGCTTENVQDTPESTFDTFVERINDEDGEGVIELTDVQFLNYSIFNEISDVVYSREEFEENITSIKESIDSGEIEINSYEIGEVIYLEDMDESNKTNMTEMIDSINDNKYFNGTIQDMCKFNFSWDVNVDEDSPLKNKVEGVNDIDFMMMYKIDGKWYMPFPITGLAAILYQNLP